MMPTLSVAMIVKNEELHLEKTLTSLDGVYDELIIVDTGSTDRTKKIAKKFKAKIFDLKLEPFHFGDARNFSFDKCTKDWILWIDADDEIINPQGIPQQLLAATSNISGYWAIYDYAFNEHGMCVSRHWKERLLRNDGSFKWQGVLHEAVIPNREINVEKTEKFRVKHDKKDEEFARSSERNYKIISKWVAKEGKDKTDPRNLLSLANACLGLQKFEEAIPWFEEFTARSGWDEEIYIALHRIAACYRMLGEPAKAVEYEFQALSVDPKIKDAYIGIGQSYMVMEDWKKAEHWLKVSMTKQAGKEATIYNPAEYDFNPWWFLGHTYANMVAEGMGEKYVDSAFECFSRCKEVMGDDIEVQKRIDTFGKMIEDREISDAVLKVGAYIKAEKNKDKLLDFLKVVPERVEDYPSICKMRSELTAKKESSGKDIVIFCGNCVEEWTPDSLKTGIGGSEEAVIHMAKRLSDEGWNVEVYNSILKDTDFDGVLYRPFWQFNPRNTIDVFVAWRQIQLFSVLDVNTKRSYLWLHDVVEPAEFLPERLEKIDKVIVLSEFHRNLFPMIPDKKIWISANGLHLPDMEIKTSRKKWKFINTSAPERGLECLLTMWPKIRDQFPNAELHWHYGWKVFDAHNSDNPERKAFKERVVKLLDQPGVFGGDRISHKEIAELTASADAWLYPTEFWEISCISAMKAQALGCIPVCTDVAALRETVKNGIITKGNDMYTNQTMQESFIGSIAGVRDFDRGEMINKAKETFSWDKVAQDWDKQFKKDLK